MGARVAGDAGVGARKARWVAAWLAALGRAVAAHSSSEVIHRRRRPPPTSPPRLPLWPDPPPVAGSVFVVAGSRNPKGGGSVQPRSKPKPGLGCRLFFLFYLINRGEHLTASVRMDLRRSEAVGATRLGISFVPPPLGF